MTDVAIRETTVTPLADGTVVRLQMSDAPLLDESATMILDVRMRLTRSGVSVLEHLQIEVMTKTQEILNSLIEDLGLKVQSAPGYPRYHSS
jgi:hypothetical protein